MTNEIMLDLIGKDRPNQNIVEVVKVCEPEQFNVKGVEYDVHVIMEIDFFGTKVKRVNMVLPYPVAPYIEHHNLLVKLSTENNNETK